MFLLIAALTLTIPSAKGLAAAPGFEVTEFAGSDLANDITCLTLDPKGRVVVAGRGYIRLLLDDDGDGRADRAVDVTRDVREHAMGLLWEGDTLLAVVDGGLQHFSIGPDGMTAVGRSQRLRTLKTGGEHSAHAIHRGPDGWLYLIGGDGAGFDQSFATVATSPIRQPIGGCLVRFSPDFKQSEIVADGFRNAYAFDFDALGFAWTFDSDNERCVSLPWYEPTRIYRIIPGGHHGWRAHQRSETWRCPPYFADVVAPVATAGRGSPTGVIVYKHTAWPADRRGVLVADWTFGKIWLLRPGFMDRPEVLVESTGDQGFAPTAMAVHPQTGDLYVSVGGRGTRGAVYRVRWNAPEARGQRIEPAVSFGVEWKPEYAKTLPEQTSKALTSEELARIYVELRRHREHFTPDVLQSVIQHWADQPDAVLFNAVADLVATLPPEDWQKLRSEMRTPPQWLLLGYGVRHRDPAAALDLALRVIELDNANRRLKDDKLRLDARWRLWAVRLVQLALGDLTAPEHRAKVWAGYTPAAPLPADRHPRARQALRAAYPSGIAELDRELTRCLAVLEDDDPALLAAIVSELTPFSDPLDDVHHLIVLSRLRGERQSRWTTATARALLSLGRKITKLKRNRDRNWPLRIAELHAELARKDPRLNDAILNHDLFGRPDHALFTRCPGFDRRGAAEKFLKASAGGDFEWDSELVGLLAELPAEVHRPIVRKLADRGGLDDAVLPLLAKSAQAEDVSRLLAGLVSPRLDVLRACLETLGKLPLPQDGPTALALIKCLRSLPEGKEADRLRERLAGLLETVTGQALGTDPKRWTAWLGRVHPDQARKLGGADGVDMIGWRQRFARIDWSSGDLSRGKEVFMRAGCASCHSGGHAMGPDLAGITGRFSRDDLFNAILRPSLEVPARYRMTQIETTDGKTYQGLIVYEAVDGLILQTSAAETVRIPGDRIESKRLTETSLMPTGLLDRLSDRDIADLHAYLKSLTK